MLEHCAGVKSGGNLVHSLPLTEISIGWTVGLLILEPAVPENDLMDQLTDTRGQRKSGQGSVFDRPKQRIEPDGFMLRRQTLPAQFDAKFKDPFRRAGGFESGIRGLEIRLSVLPDHIAAILF